MNSSIIDGQIILKGNLFHSVVKRAARTKMC
jgi:hypothetical protein